MKKNILLAATLLFVAAAHCYVLPDTVEDDGYFIPDIPADLWGVYLPYEYIVSLEVTRSHFAARGLNREQYYHDVLLVKKNIVYSDVGFHDGYAIPASEFKAYKPSRDPYPFSYDSPFFSKSHKAVLLDDKGTAYIQISDNTDDYYDDVADFVGKIVFRGASFDYAAAGYKIELDEAFMEKGANLLLYNTTTKERLYMKIEGREYVFYKMQRNGAGWSKTNEVIFRFK
ncbi:MAG: hypothetical protein Ta2A_07490 [Treponemataceae bacterium]|nr:MAG: hypothetical protein Ta2A_07490 [Treponemataceae bacterium]